MSVVFFFSLFGPASLEMAFSLNAVLFQELHEGKISPTLYILPSSACSGFMDDCCVPDTQTLCISGPSGLMVTLQVETIDTTALSHLLTCVCGTPVHFVAVYMVLLSTYMTHPLDGETLPP